MNLHSKLVVAVAAVTLAYGLGATAMAADPTTPAPLGAAAPTAKPGTPLVDVQKPKEAFVGAKVNDSKGDAVGEVRAVKLGPDGKIASVDVNVGTKIVVLKADSLSYAEADKTITSTQTKAEIQSLNAM